MVSLIILAQLGGRRFILMTGAKNLQSTPNSFSFRLPKAFALQGINHVKIELTPADLYRVTFGKIKGLDYKIIRVEDGIYADGLRLTFTHYTGLDTSLGKVN